MLKLLLKKQLTEIFRNYIFDQKKNRARSRAATIGYLLLFLGLMVGLMGGMFTYLSMALCQSFADVGMDWLYFSIMGMLAVLLGVFGSVFSTYSSLYLSKDNDLLLSMPISTNAIIASRLLSVYLMGALYAMLVILPAVIVYWTVVPVSVGVILSGLLFILLITFFVFTLSCALGWVVAKVSLKLRHKSFITMLISLGFIGLYYFLYFKAQSVLQELIANAAVYGEKIKGAAYPLYLFGQVAVGDVLATVVVSAVILALMGLMWLLISRSFLKIAISSGSSPKTKYKETTAKHRSVATALLAKEWARLTSSPNYMLNCGLGIILLPLGGVMLLWQSGNVISLLNQIFGARPGSVPLLLCAMVCLLASMNDTAAPSVSLEGSSLWLLQSLPVTPWQVLRAKLTLQVLLTVFPVLFCLLCLLFVYPFSPLEILFTLLVPLSYVLFSALFSLFLGVKTANLTWSSEITPIKQNVGVMIALFGGFAYAIVLVVGFLALNGWKLGFVGYMALFEAVTLALCALLWFWLKKEGCSRFAAL